MAELINANTLFAAILLHADACLQSRKALLEDVPVLVEVTADGIDVFLDGIPFVLLLLTRAAGARSLPGARSVILGLRLSNRDNAIA